MKENLQKIFEQYVDFLMPELTPYEASLYMFFLRNSHIKTLQKLELAKELLPRIMAKVLVAKKQIMPMWRVPRF